MRHRIATALLGIMLVSPFSSAHSQTHAPVCASGAATLPPALAAWPTRGPLIATGKASALKSAALVVGSPVDATLGSTADIQYVTRPEKPGGSVSYGGLFSFTIKDAGTYRVALGSGAWIDVLKGKAAMASVAHGHGPDCSGIRKMVDFRLSPGRYTLQIAANGEQTLPLMIARLP
jgi:hypothetical protein